MGVRSPGSERGTLGQGKKGELADLQKSKGEVRKWLF